MSIDQTSLAQLEGKIDAHIRLNGHGQQVLDKYLEWLHQQVVKDIFEREDSLIYTWIQSLRNRGIEDDIIHSSFKGWQNTADQEDPSSRRRYLMAEDEICRILNDNGVPQLDSHIDSLQSRLIGTNSRSKPTLGASRSPSPGNWRRVRGYKRKRTGANDMPVVNNRRASPSHSPVRSGSGAKWKPQSKEHTYVCKRCHKSGWPPIDISQMSLLTIDKAILFRTARPIWTPVMIHHLPLTIDATFAARWEFILEHSALIITKSGHLTPKERSMLPNPWLGNSEIEMTEENDHRCGPAYQFASIPIITAREALLELVTRSQIATAPAIERDQCHL